MVEPAWQQKREGVSVSSLHALVVQVKGLQAEYMRVSENRPPAGSKEEREEEEARQRLEEYRSKAQQAEVSGSEPCHR